MATNNATNTSNPISIAQGGTSAASMATSTGIVKYDGSALVTSSTAKIDSSNRQTNTSQPAFLAYKSATTTNTTGDGTQYTVLFDTKAFDQGTNYNTGTGTFTAPVTGNYLFMAGVLLTNIVAGHTSGGSLLIITAGNFPQSNCNPGAVAASGQWYATCHAITPMTAGDTATFAVSIAGSTKTVSVFGEASRRCFFSGQLIC